MQDLYGHLTRTSRTFALSIRLLEPTLRKQVAIAYLLLRVADTLADAEGWTAEDRVIALAQLDLMLGLNDTVAAEQASERWVNDKPCAHAGYLALIAALPELIEAGTLLHPAIWSTIVRHVRRTIQGMMGFFSRDGVPCELCLQSFEEVRAYVYVVAGIPGELMTELFVTQKHVSPASAAEPWNRARCFCEGLHIVNILKKENDREARRSRLPPGIDRERLVALAQDDLAIGDDYVKTLRKVGASFGILGFTMLPLRLAHHALDELTPRAHLEEVTVSR